jgi:hypothetical protein
MKFSLISAPRRPLDRQTAWGCLTTNQFGLPGLGSLAAGRRTGYGQMALSLAGVAITAAYGVRFMTWYVSSSAKLQQLQSQPDVYLHEIWIHLRWPLLGFAVFLAGWLWALASSICIVSQATPGADKVAPPRINP